MFFILTNGPLSAINVTHRVWMESIKTALAEEGYNKFPLNFEDSKEFIDRLKTKNTPQTKIVLSRLRELNYKDFAQFTTFKNRDYIDQASNNERVSIFKAYIREPENNYFDIPQNVSKVSYFYKTFRQKDYEFRNDTLFFQLKPEKLNKTLKFFVTKEALEQKDVRFLETEGVKIGVEQLEVDIKDVKKENYLYIRGILFLE